MSINQYKLYKNNEITLLDIKLQNIGINRLATYLIKNKKYIITLLILFSGYIASELYLNEQMMNINNAFNYNIDECANLFNSNNSSVSNM
jgi:hypothetical protein